MVAALSTLLSALRRMLRKAGNLFCTAYDRSSPCPYMTPVLCPSWRKPSTIRSASGPDIAQSKYAHTFWYRRRKLCFLFSLTSNTCEMTYLNWSPIVPITASLMPYVPSWISAAMIATLLKFVQPAISRRTSSTISLVCLLVSCYGDAHVWLLTWMV